MKTVRFLETRTEQRIDGRTFEEGSVHLLEDGSALHWIKRGIAVEVEPAEPVQQDVVLHSQPDNTASAVIESTDGDTLDSPADVAGENSGDTGERAINEPQRRRGRPPSQRNSGQ